MSISKPRASQNQAHNHNEDEGSDEAPDQVMRLASESSNLHFYNHPCVFELPHDDAKSQILVKRRFNLSEVDYDEAKKIGTYRADHNQLTRILQPHAALFSGDFIESSVSEFCVSLEQICNKAAARGQTVIPIYIDSFGGDVYSLLKLLDTMHALRDTYKIKFATIAQGKAMSAGAFMLMFGDIGYRYATPRTTIMIHDISSGMVGRMSELQAAFKEAERLSDAVMSSMGSYITGGKSKTYLMDLLEKTKHTDLYLSANEAKDAMIVDHVGIPQFVFSMNIQEKVVPLDQSNWMSDFGTI
mgnify:CR=1 FL=1